jgi:hypothetical protein
VTEWAQFQALDLARLKREMAQPIIIDLRSVYRPDDMGRLGFTYESVGRPSIHHELIPAIISTINMVTFSYKIGPYTPNVQIDPVTLSRRDDDENVLS